MDRKKELKLMYKETNRPMGVYQIKNCQNDKILIGCSSDLPGKFNSHRFQLEHRSHVNAALQTDWLTNGPDAFEFETLELLSPEKFAKEDWHKALADMEDKWLSIKRPYGDNGYNKEKRLK